MKLNRAVLVGLVIFCSCSPINTYMINKRDGSYDYYVVEGDRNFYRESDQVISVSDFRDTQMLLHEHFHFLSTIYPPSEEFKEECLRAVNQGEHSWMTSFARDDSRRYIESTYNALSKGKIKLSYTHKDSYWKDEKNIWNETYSNLLVIRASGRWSQIKELEKAYPKVIELFLKDVSYHGIK